MNISSTLNFVSKSFLFFALLIHVGQMKSADLAYRWAQQPTQPSGSTAISNSAASWLPSFGRTGSTSTTPAASGTWSLPSLPSWLRSSATSGSTPSVSPAAQTQSFAPSSTQLATGAALSTAALLAYSYLYRTLSANYTKVSDRYKEILPFIEKIKKVNPDITPQELITNFSAEEKKQFLTKVDAINKKAGYKDEDFTGSLINFKANLIDDITSLSTLGSWTTFGFSLYNNVKTLTKDLQYLLQVVELLIRPQSGNLSRLPRTTDPVHPKKQEAATKIAPSKSMASPEEIAAARKEQDEMNAKQDLINILLNTKAEQSKTEQLASDTLKQIRSLIDSLNSIQQLDDFVSGKTFINFVNKYPAEFLYLISGMPAESRNRTLQKVETLTHFESIFKYIDQLLPTEPEFLKFILFFPDIFIEYIKSDTPERVKDRQINAGYFVQSYSNQTIPEDTRKAIAAAWDSSVKKQTAQPLSPATSTQQKRVESLPPAVPNKPKKEPKKINFSRPKIQPQNKGMNV